MITDGIRSDLVLELVEPHGEVRLLAVGELDVVEEDVCGYLVVRHLHRGFREPLEPVQMLDVVSPVLALELLGGEVLLVLSLRAVENDEQRLLFHLGYH